MGVYGGDKVLPYLISNLSREPQTNIKIILNYKTIT
jgi:hypothetical protein